MNTHELIITLIIIGAVIFAIARQVMPQQVRLLPFVFFPAIAAYESYRLLPRPIIPVSQIVECLLIVVVGLVVGAIQATTTRVYHKDNKLYMNGGLVSLISWLALMFIRFIISFIFHGFGLFTSFQSFEWIIWAAFAVTFGSRSLILYMRYPEIGQALAAEQANKRKHRNR
jgi:membrane protein CcdC involved in cytochrome C biogenesis